MSYAANTEPWEALNPRAALIVIHKSSWRNTMIVPTLQRGNASQDAPRPLSNVAQMLTLIHK